MTTALLSLFAACTNDDFVSYEQGAQSGDAALRPSVDVTLNVSEGNGADTRLTFIPGEDEGYLWETNDTIGALLMDKVIAEQNGEAIRPHDDIEKWEEMAWTSRYQLVDYINTNYPFVRQADGSWQTNAKMLEGNYFFTFPFASYSGNREAIHSIGEQVQDGTSDASLQEAYAKNQFFIGYARIHAGTEGGDVMSADLEMTPVLGAVAVKIKNVGTQDFTVKKIVLQSNSFNTLIKVDPTSAKYAGEDGKKASPYYNIVRNSTYPTWDQANYYFNYANYEESYEHDFEERYADAVNGNIYGFGNLVNNTEKSVNYNRKNALRAVMNGLTGVDGADNRAELTVLNAPVQKGNNPEVVENFVIMTNIYEYTDDNSKIDAYIYTDRGMVGPVTISNVKGEMDGGNEVTVITENPIVKIGPDQKNSVTLEIDDNSIQKDFGMEVYNESDLLQLIEWNQSTARVYTATLQNNVTLTKEMTDLLTNGTRSRLFINTNGNKLTLDNDAAADVLDYVLVDGGEMNGTDANVATIVVKNNLTLGSKSFVNGKYNVGNIQSGDITLTNEFEVAEGASLTVATAITKETRGDYQNQKLVIAENEGTVTINANAQVEDLTIAENKADVTINANVTFTGNSKNMENATITIGKGAIVSAAGKLTNQGENDYTAYEDADFAVIYNNGQINNLVNKAYGKVIAGEGSTTNADSQDANAEIDKSADINAVVKVNNTDSGFITYTVKDEIALTAIIKSGITKLVINGGAVIGTTYGINVPAANYTASNVKWIEVKGQGGSLGTEIVVTNGVPSHFTSVFPNVIEITTSADATIADATFKASDIDFNIEAATTSIRGTVDAAKADVVIGSYDSRNYKGVDATLNIPATTGVLNVNAISKTTDHTDEVVAKVINQGNIQLPYNVEPGRGLVWEGAGKVNGEDPNAGQKAPAGDAGNATNYTLSDLDKLKDDLAKKDWTKVTSVTITSSIVPTEEQYADLKELLAGKELILSNALNLSNGDGTLTVDKLTIPSGTAYVGDANEFSQKIMLTVNSLEVKSGATLNVNESWILVTGTVRPLSSGKVVVNGTLNFDGKGGAIVTANNADPQGAYLMWNKDNKRFEEQK